MTAYARLAGTGLATLDVLIVGGSFSALSAISAFPLASGQAVRYSIGAALLFAISQGRLRRPSRSQLGVLFALACVGVAGGNALMVVAVRHAEPGAVGVIIGCVPVAVVLVGHAIARRRPSATTLVAAALVTLGAAVVSGSDRDLELIGLIAAVGALASQTLFMLCIAKPLEELGAFTVAAWTCLLSVAPFAVVAVLFDAHRLPTVEEGAAILFLGALVTGLAFLCWSLALLLIGRDRVALFTGAVPVAALVIAALTGEGTISVTAVVGALLVASGIVIGVASTRGAPQLVGELSP